MVSRQELKSFFEAGDQPTQAQFEALIDACYNEDPPVNPPVDPPVDPPVTPPATSNFVLDGGDGSSVGDQIDAAFAGAGVAVKDDAGGIVDLFTTQAALLNYGAGLSPAAMINPETYEITYADGSARDIPVAFAEVTCLKSINADSETATVFGPVGGRATSEMAEVDPETGRTSYIHTYTDAFGQVFVVAVTQRAPLSDGSLPGVTNPVTLTWGANRARDLHEIDITLLSGPTAGACRCKPIFQIGASDFDSSGFYVRPPNSLQSFADIFTQSGPVVITQTDDRFDAVLPEGASSTSSVNQMASFYELEIGQTISLQFESFGGADAVNLSFYRIESSQIAEGILVGDTIYSAVDHEGNAITDLTTLEVQVSRPTARATFIDGVIDISASTPDEFGLAGFDFIHERAGEELTQRSTTSSIYPLETTQPGDTLIIRVFDISGSRSLPITLTV